MLSKLRWKILDWVHDKDHRLAHIDENQQYHVDWEEVKLIPEFLFYETRCRVLNRCHLPLFGVCLHCGKKLKPGDYIGWFEKYDPEHNLGHAFLADPFTPMIQMGIRAKTIKTIKAHDDANALFKEAHK